jgi:hypothetical protein
LYRLLIVPFLIFLVPIKADAFHFTELYKNLPDYEKNPPFTIEDKMLHAELRKSLSNISPYTKQCRAGSVLVWKAPIIGNERGKDWRIDLWTNVCDLKKYKIVKGLIANLTLSLSPDNVTFWITDLDGDHEPDLIVGYIDISKGELKYPYLSLWRFKYSDGAYKALYAGPFLNGTFHAVRGFGTNPSKKAVFVKHLSCIECEPIVYLTAIDFEASDDAHAYEFTYSEKHEGFDPIIEYGLPGMGHTVDAEVETRPLPPSESGPHLLQFFDVEGGPKEWWAFTCKEYKCDYQLYKNEAPPNFRSLWKKAKRI